MEALKRVAIGTAARSRMDAEIARELVYLVSEGAAYRTGQNIRVDVGITRSV